AGVSMRARYTSFPTGYSWFDDFTIEELDVMPNVLVNGDFETVEPGFWNRLNDGMATLSWASDEAAPNPWATTVPSERSLKVEKSGATADMAGWMSDNNADLYWNNAAGALYTLRFWAKTSGVNTGPGNQDAMTGVWYRFYSGGTLLAEQFVGVDQSAASVDWTEYTGALLLTAEPDEVYAVAVMGKDATGTVWFDNVDCWTDPWSMGIFNADMETPTGWMYWFDTGKVGYAGMTTDTSHSGMYSIMLVDKDTLDDEIVYYSEPAPAQPDKWYKLGVWVKTDSVNNDMDWLASNVTPDRDNNRMGVTFFFHRAPVDHSWDLTGGDQFFYVDQRMPGTSWTHYNVIAKSPADAAGVSMRARYTSFPTGYSWFDDFTIEPVELVPVGIEDPPAPVSTLSSNFHLMQNYPNPFNPETVIEYLVPQNGPVELNIYNTLGQKIRTLVNEVRTAGTYHVLWDGTDDYGNKVATGIYLYQLRGKNALITRKMMLVK
ncbi:MAG: FlgD immunoglobulin-like domain containing protein, partial [Calditrichia bacterium]